MNIASDDARIVRFYDELFSKASRIITHFKQHPPVVAVLHASGAVPAVLALNLSPEDRLSLLIALASEPRAQAAALVTETRCPQAEHGSTEDRPLIQLLQHGQLAEQPGQQDALLIAILTATDLAVMICKIDRIANTVQKEPLTWTGKATHLSFACQPVRAGVDIQH